ncbi:Hua1 [Kluyveromyces lactis]|nr:Hua1 [Kluyveromyces lactis]
MAASVKESGILPSYEEAVGEGSSTGASRHQEASNDESNDESNDASTDAPNNATNSTTSSSNTGTDIDQLPWTYPPWYYCRRCGNTGVETRTQRRCRTCWSRFNRRQFPVRRGLILTVVLLGVAVVKHLGKHVSNASHASHAAHATD